ncbi:6509_t:CDS:2, partial [Paraglomus occultum]
ECGLTIAKKLETHEVGDLTEAYLLEELHPKREPLSRGFDRPKPPGRRTHRT